MIVIKAEGRCDTMDAKGNVSGISTGQLSFGSLWAEMYMIRMGELHM